jgi:hypothetical protein
MEVFPDVQESDPAARVEEQGGRVRHADLEALGVGLQEAELPDQAALRVGQEEDPIGEPELPDEEPGPLVDLGCRT